MGPLQDLAALFFLALLGISAAWMWVTGQLGEAA